MMKDRVELLATPDDSLLVKLFILEQQRVVDRVVLGRTMMSDTVDPDVSMAAVTLNDSLMFSYDNTRADAFRYYSFTKDTTAYVQDPPLLPLPTEATEFKDPNSFNAMTIRALRCGCCEWCSAACHHHTLPPPRAVTTISPVPFVCDRRVVTFLTLSPSQRKFFIILFYSPISELEKVTNLAYLGSKTLLQRCMTRKMDSVLLKLFLPRQVTKKNVVTLVHPSKTVVIKVSRFLKCSLLGNYPHTPPPQRMPNTNTMENGEVFHGRQYVYESVSSDMLIKLTRECTQLVTFAIREYLLFVVEDDPVFGEYHSYVVDTGAFRTIMNEAMHAARKHIQQYGGFNELPILSAVMEGYHNRILDISYKRPEDTIGTMINSFRQPRNIDDKLVGIPLVPIPGLANVYPEHDSNRYLPPLQYNALITMVKKVLGMKEVNALSVCIWHLRCFGAPVEQLDRIRAEIQDVRLGRAKVKRLRAAFVKLQSEYPGVYNLIQLTNEAIRHLESLRITGQLPTFMTNYQIEALKSRFGIQENFIINSSLYLSFCHVCKTVYSLVNEFKSAFRNSYR